MSGEKRKYDERQALSRARAGQMAFWILAAMVSANCLLREILGRPWATPLAEEVILILPPLIAWRVRCIWTDADAPLHDRQRRSLGLDIAKIVTSLLLGIQGIRRGLTAENGMLTEECAWLLFALGFGAILIASALRRRKDAREEAEE